MDLEIQVSMLTLIFYDNFLLTGVPSMLIGMTGIRVNRRLFTCTECEWLGMGLGQMIQLCSFGQEAGGASSVDEED